MSLLGPGSQRMEQEKRCSRFPQLLPPQHHRVGQGCSARGPCLPGDRAAAAPASVHPTPHRELELLPPSLLTLPSFPTPSSSALSLSEVEMNSQILSLQLLPLSVLAPAQNSSTSLCSWLQQAQLQPLHLTCPRHSHNSQPASSTTHRENNLHILLETPLQGKNAPGCEGYSQRKLKPNIVTEAKRQDVLQLQQCLCFTFSHNPSLVSLEAISCAALSWPLSLGQN